MLALSSTMERESLITNRKEQPIYQVNLRVKKRDYERLKRLADIKRMTVQHYIMSRLVEAGMIGDNEDEGNKEYVRT